MKIKVKDKHGWIPWMHITQLKGIFGELCVEKFLNLYGFKIKREPTYTEFPIPEHMTIHYEIHVKIARNLIKRYGSYTIPDFKVVGKRVFIEVKTGREARLENNQQKEFPNIVKKGYKILIIKPQIEFRKNEAIMTDFSCREYSPNGNWSDVDLLECMKTSE